MSDREIYEIAARRADAKFDFYAHLTVYFLANLLFIDIYFVYNVSALWILVPLVGWAVGLLAHGLVVGEAPASSGSVPARRPPVRGQINRRRTYPLQKLSSSAK